MLEVQNNVLKLSGYLSTKQVKLDPEDAAKNSYKPDILLMSVGGLSIANTIHRHIQMLAIKGCLKVNVIFHIEDVEPPDGKNPKYGDTIKKYKRTKVHRRRS